MGMSITETDLEGVFVIVPQVFRDARGWFAETWSLPRFTEHALPVVFVQDNHSCTQKAGTLRGLHFQNDPSAQTKLVRCTRGRILDVAVDLRRGSPTFLRWTSVELSAADGRQIWIPRGFAHGFLTLEDDVEVQYKTDRPYDGQRDRSVRFDDPAFGIVWGVADPLVSDKDAKAPLWAHCDCNFVYAASETAPRPGQEDQA
jgi:dTDP-4-dehydrorhamnose 3,5-epimerase